MPKRKRETVAGDNPEVGFGRGGARGGAGRGQGRKAAAKPFGTAAAAAEQTAATPEQKSISELGGGPRVDLELPVEVSCHLAVAHDSAR